MPGSIDARSPTVSTTGFSDGLGRRVIRFDRELGATLESVQLRPELGIYEQSLRAQAGALAALDDERFVRIRSIDRDGNRVSVTSELVAGDRLSDIIEARSLGDAAVSGLDAAFGFLLQVLPALARLHAAGLVHGIVAPGRVILSATARVVLADPIYGAALPRLNLSRRRLWTELHVVAAPSAGPVRFDAAADVSQASLCGLMLALGRTIDAADPVDALPALVNEAAEIAQIRGGDALADSVRRFFTTTLPLGGPRAAVGAEQAAREAQAIANGELGEDACISALGEFVRYEAPPAPVPVPRSAAPVLRFQPAPVIVEPDPVSLEAIEDTVEEAIDEPIAIDAVYDEPVMLAADPEPEVFAAEPVLPEPMLSAPMIPEPVRPEPVLAAAVFVEPQPEPEPEPLRPAPVVAESVMADFAAVFVPERQEPAPVAAIEPKPEPVAPPPPPPPPAPVPAPAPVVEEPLVRRQSGDIVFEPAFAPPAPPPVVPQFTYAPPSTPPPMPVPMPVFPPAPTVAAPTRPAVVPPNPFAFAPASAPAPPPVQAAPAPLRLKQDGPGGYTPPRPAQRFDQTLADAPFVHVPAPQPEGGFPKKLAIAVVAVMVIAVVGGKFLMSMERAEAPESTANAPAKSPPRPAPTVVEAKTTAPVGSTGILTIESIPTGAKVLLNGTHVGETPLRLEGLPQGRQTVTLITDSVTVKRTVHVEAGKTVVLDVPVFSGWVAIFAPIVLEVSEGSKGLGSTEQGRILLAPGRHELTVTNRALGYSSTHTVEIGAGEETPLNLTPTGQVNLNANPWAEVWVDGNRVGETPLANLEVPLGTREFVFKHPQHGERRVTATVTATAPSAVSVDFVKQP